MCAFECDSCFHKKVCDEEPAFFAVNKECALYTNVKILTDVQQLKAEIAALADEYEGYVHNCIDHGVLDLVRELRQLSAV